MHEPIPLGTLAMNDEACLAPVDVSLSRLPNIDGELGRLKDQIGVTTTAGRRSEPIKYQQKPDGITMRHTDEKQHLAGQVMEARAG